MAEGSPPEPIEQQRAIGSGFEIELGKIWTDPHTKVEHHWLERYLFVRSDALAQKRIEQLDRRLEQAETALNKLAAKSFDDCCVLQGKYQAILNKYQLNDLLSISINYECVIRHQRRGRPSEQDRSSQSYQDQFSITFERQVDAIEQAKQLAGWRIYVTNVPTQRLSLPQAVAYYRAQWQLERGYHRFKRGQLPALPIFLSNEERIQGLMFVLTIALRGFTLIEYQVRRQLHKQNQQLAGLYDGNPKRATQRPSAEQLLGAFCNLTLLHHRDGTTEITPLNDLQRRILQLMGIPESVYALASTQVQIPVPA